MSPRFVTPKWRPTLGMIVFAVLATVAALPFAAATILRLDETAAGGRIGFETAVLGFAAVAIVTLAIGFVFLRTITRPIADLRGRMTSISGGDRGSIAPMAHCGTQDIAELAESMLTMAHALSHKSDYTRTLAAHLSHEFKSPLTSIQGATELLKDGGTGMSEADRIHFLDNIEADAERLTLLLRRLRELAMAEEPIAAATADLAGIIREIDATADNVDVRLESEAPVTIGMSREGAMIIFSHLVDNAAKHDATTVAIRAASEDGYVHIAVSDNGNGISPENHDRLFEAFFTTRRDSGGTGMGLNVVQSMLQAHGGSIRLSNGDAGASFDLEIPAGHQPSDGSW